MGKKAEKWKAKYEDLMQASERYIRHLQDARRDCRAQGELTLEVPEEHWGCDEDCGHDQSGPDRSAAHDGDLEDRIRDLEGRIDELEAEVAEKDHELAEEIEARESQETEAEEAISDLEGEKGRLEYRVDDLEHTLRDLAQCVQSLRVLRSSLEGLEPDQRVHLFDSEWEDVLASCRDALELLEVPSPAPGT